MPHLFYSMFQPLRITSVIYHKTYNEILNDILIYSVSNKSCEGKKKRCNNQGMLEGSRTITLDVFELIASLFENLLIIFSKVRGNGKLEVNDKGSFFIFY